MRISVLLVAVFVGLLVAPPPSPVHLSYAASDSMAPTIGANDGFVLVTWGEVSPGDVVTFYSEQREEYVTHRIVGESNGGYVTKGDANAETDQMGGHPPVDDGDVVGKAFGIGGSVLVIPGLGVVLGWLQSNALVAALGAALAAGVYWFVRTGPDRTVERPAPTARGVVRPILVVAAVGSLVVVALVGGSTYHFQYQAVDGDPTTGSEVTAGDPAERSFEIRTTSPGMSTVFVEADGMSVDEQTVEDGTVALNATIHPPAEPGRFRTTVRTYAYPGTLPEPALRWLHAVHPLLAAVLSVGVVFGPLFVAYLALFDRSAPIRPPRTRGIRRLLEGDR